MGGFLGPKKPIFFQYMHETFFVFSPEMPYLQPVDRCGCAGGWTGDK